jgi:hypothetical protein
MRQTTQNVSHLRRCQTTLPDPREDSAVWLPPLDARLIVAYCAAADRNRLLYRWLWRGYWVLCVETGILLGLGITWIVNRL